MTCQSPNWPQLAADYNAGKSARAIARELGRASFGVRKQLRKHGAAIRPSNTAPANALPHDGVECPTCGLPAPKYQRRDWLGTYGHRCEHGVSCRGISKGAGARCPECEPDHVPEVAERVSGGVSWLDRAVEGGC